MKITVPVFTILVIFAACSASPTLYKLNIFCDHILDFFVIIPKDTIGEIVGLTAAHVAFDLDFKEAFQYVMSDKFTQVILSVLNIEEFIDLLKFIGKASLIPGEDENTVRSIKCGPIEFPLSELKIPSSIINFSMENNNGNLGGIKGFLDKVFAVLPMDKFKELYQEKMQNSKDFVRFVETMRSDNFTKVADALKRNEKFQELVTEVRKKIDLDAIYEYWITILHSVTGQTWL